METNTWSWIGFNAFILLMMAIDLGIFNRKTHVVSAKEGLIWTGVFVGLAVLFGIGLSIFGTREQSLEFFAGWLIEYALSIDNIFVFILIFSFFKVDPKYQHKVLFWGIIGALLLRALFIWLGTTLLEQFEWVIYIFGAFLIYTAVKMAFQKEEGIHPEHNPVVKLFRRFVPVTSGYVDGEFFHKQNGRRYATPLFIVLIIVETTDVVFALDSIPAIFAVSRDPFIVYTSNVFAIMGLRSLYFALAGLMGKFHYLKIGLSFVLGFVGLKMILSDIYHVPIGISLAVIAGLLVLSVVGSLVWPKPELTDEEIKQLVD